MANLVILADDLTGAGDSGVTFARSGLRTALLFNSRNLGGIFARYDALAISSESRFMSPSEAEREVYSLAGRCRRAGGESFFKKVDSVMRGNPGAEIRAVLKALGIPAAVVCPALPSAGRALIGGTILVNGRPLHDTPLGRDPFTPVKSADVRKIMAGDPASRIGLLGLDDIAKGLDAVRGRVRKLLDEGCGIIVADAASDTDLAVLADLLRAANAGDPELPPLLPAGSSGLARALAGPPATSALEPGGRLLAVVGSLDGMALQQAERACGPGRFVMVPVDVEAGLADPEAECARVLAEAGKAGSSPVLLRGKKVPEQGRISLAEGSRVAELYGMLAARLCRGDAFQAVYATGGGTAAAVAEALGIENLTLESELLPGVVLSSCAAPGAAVRQFVSKSGSFGDRDTLRAVASSFCKERIA